MGEIDEADLLLLLNKKYDKDLFIFDSKNQRILKIKDVILPEEMRPFVDEEGVFNCTKYYLTFVEEVHRVISEGLVELPPGLTLSTDYTPCETCKIDDDFPVQYVR